MNKRRFVAIVLSTLLLAGCGMSPAVTEKEMKDAASFALNVDASKVTISNVDKKGLKPISSPPSITRPTVAT